MASYRTVLLTGLPRAGTTLCCHILNSCKGVLALHEPLSPDDFSSEQPRETALGIIAGSSRAPAPASKLPGSHCLGTRMARSRRIPFL